MPTKMLFLQGALYTLIASLTPVGTVLVSNQPLTGRAIAALIVAALIAGATALKAFLSTNFADSATGQKMREEAAGHMAKMGHGRAD